jgi:ligand-binding sensor domain-containing protein
MKFNCFAFLSIAVLGVAQTNAQWIQTAGPISGNKTGCLLVSGANLFAGTDSGGVYVSANSGTSWNAVDTGLTERYVWALASLDTDLFAGTSGGVFRSANNGATWSDVNTGLGSSGVSAFAVIANGTGGASLFAGTNAGVYLSTNAGTKWKAVKTGLTNTQVRALAVIDTNLFAGTLGGGVFLSTNNGTTWTAVNTGLGNTSSVYALAVAPDGTNGKTLFAGTGDGVYLSADNGANWRSASAGLELAGAIYALEVYSNGTNGTCLFAATWVDSVALSTDNGTSWRSVSAGLTNPGPLRSLAVSGTNLFVGTTNNGVWRRPISEMLSASVKLHPGNGSSGFALTQKRPNSFNSTTALRFDVPKASNVRLGVYDMCGREVRTLVNEMKLPGSYEVVFSAKYLANGAYLFLLQAGNNVIAQKCLLSR